MLILRLVLTALCLMPLVSMAQSKFVASAEALRKTSDGFIASAAAGNFGGALKELRPYSVISSADFDLFEAQVNSQQANLLRQFGSPKGYEFLREDKLGSRMVRHQYLVFHEKSALRWTFVFFKAEKGWVVTHFFFDGNAMNFFPSGG
jgi:hypothetical protein